jgi:hypothetical protein
MLDPFGVNLRCAHVASRPQAASTAGSSAVLSLFGCACFAAGLLLARLAPAPSSQVQCDVRTEGGYMDATVIKKKLCLDESSLPLMRPARQAGAIEGEQQPCGHPALAPPDSSSHSLQSLPPSLPAQSTANANTSRNHSSRPVTAGGKGTCSGGGTGMWRIKTVVLFAYSVAVASSLVASASVHWCSLPAYVAANFFSKPLLIGFQSKFAKLH